MKMLRLLAIGLIMTFGTACFFSPRPAFSGQAIPVHSEWKGKATGQVFGRAFNVPIFIEIKKSLPGENNPFHIAIGDEKDANKIGSFLIMSALQFTAPYSGGKATLQYLTVHVRGSQAKAVLTNEHRQEAAAANAFTAPNVSAQYSSELMRGVLQDALGPTEQFAFKRGATLIINFGGNQLNGIVEGFGSSYLGTYHPDVHFRAQFVARRVR